MKEKSNQRLWIQQRQVQLKVLLAARESILTRTVGIRQSKIKVNNSDTDFCPTDFKLLIAYKEVHNFYLLLKAHFIKIHTAKIKSEFYVELYCVRSDVRYIFENEFFITYF